jgi:hypothetical protein
VIGEWTVPDVAADPGDYYAAEWVGIDGEWSSDVLQAGTETEIVGGVHHTYPWWEWFPEDEVQITNLPVSAGDIMVCYIVAKSATQAFF